MINNASLESSRNILQEKEITEGLPLNQGMYLSPISPAVSALNMPPSSVLARSMSDASHFAPVDLSRCAGACSEPSLVRMTGYHYDANRRVRFSEELSAHQSEKGQCFLRRKSSEYLQATIAGGGSGALVFSVRDEVSPVSRLRKIMLNKDHDPEPVRERLQDAEAKAGAILLGYESASDFKDHPILKRILESKAEIIKEFAATTRPKVMSRFILTAPNPEVLKDGSSMCLRIGVGYDQELVVDSENNPATQFSEVIENKNQPLQPLALKQLVDTQLALTETLYNYQKEIYLTAPLSKEEGIAEFKKSYLHRLEKRVTEPLAANKFSGFNLPLSDEVSVNLETLLTQDTVEINGKRYKNPLTLLVAHAADQAAHKNGFVMHGDLQQSNAMYYVDQSNQGKLVCIDNRPSDVKDYLFDLIKIMWGPSFIPVLDDHVDIRVTGEGGFFYGAKDDFKKSKLNLEAFNRAYFEAIKQSPIMRGVLADNPHWEQHGSYCKALQFLCDLGFVVPELVHAKEHNLEARVQRLGRRMVADFIEAALAADQFSNKKIS